jgi:glycosyltransferase involved in cell wall biosynthesis
MKKVALIINSISRTSVPTYWVDEAKILTTNEFKIKIIPINLASIRNVSEALSCDIIQCHHYKSALTILLASFVMFKRKPKFIFVSQGSHLFLSTFNKLISYIIFIFFNHIIFVNKELYSQYNKIYKKIINTKYSVIFNAIGEITDMPNKENILDKYNINSERLIIFNPARTVLEKNQIRLIDSVKILSAKNNNILLVIAGNGAMFNDLFEYIKKNELEKNVMLLGEIPREDVLSFYAVANVYCMPSISEGLNTTYLEAIQAKVKIVVSDIPQFTYPLENKNLNAEDLTVRYINPYSSSDIATSIENSLIDKGKSKLTKFPFLLKDMFLEYDKLYQRI